MRFPEPFFIPSKNPPRNQILFAASQLQGEREAQEDFFLNYNDECFVITDGVGGMPHGEVASRLAAETAIWGYKHIRQRPMYWIDKKKLLRRIVRSTNLTIWQKKREPGYETGLHTTLLVCIVTPDKFFIGSVGDSSAFLYRDGLIDVLTTTDRDEAGRLTKALGTQRLGLVPQIRVERFLPGDLVMMASDGVADYVSEDAMRRVFDHTGDDSQSLESAAEHLVKEAQAGGSTDNMTVCLVKKIRK